MSLISATRLGKSFGAADIFFGVTVSIPNLARIGLVGPNGVGKTTLLRILAGEETPTEGRIQRARNLEIGMLPQEAGLFTDHTLWEECLTAFESLRSLEVRLAQLETAMADPRHADSALARYGPLQETFEQQGGYTYASRIRLTLTGLGFDPDEFDRRISKLSGGQRTRALLARLLLSSPDLLILDEPTNHLDIAAVEWLEKHLQSWEGAAVIVSHDRYFLDRVVSTIWEMDSMGFEQYRSNYTAYVTDRERRWSHRQKLYEAEIARLEKELDYVRRNIAGQNTTHAKGKLRRLSRQVQAIEQLGVPAVLGKSWSEVSAQVDITTSMLGVEEIGRRIKGLTVPRPKTRSLNLNLNARSRSGDLVLRTDSLAIGYPGDRGTLFQMPDLLLKRGECAAIIGPNGSGKTTFLKTLLGWVDPLRGKYSLGASLKLGYFAQAHEDLNLTHNLIEEIQAVSPDMRVSEIRAYLGRYQFSGDDVFKRVQDLSGGERGRLALAKLVLKEANLLLLDEPTNHLDIPSQEVLQSVLADYQGTILLVSHDRYLIDALATQIWEIDAGNASLAVYQGSYSEYRAEKERQAQDIRSLADDLPAKRGTSPAVREKRRAQAEEKRRKARLEAIEVQVAELEAQLLSLSKRLESPLDELHEVQQLGEAYVQTQDQLDELLKEWETLNVQP